MDVSVFLDCGLSLDPGDRLRLPGFVHTYRSHTLANCCDPDRVRNRHCLEWSAGAGRSGAELLVASMDSTLPHLKDSRERLLDS